VTIEQAIFFDVQIIPLHVIMLKGLHRTVPRQAAQPKDRGGNMASDKKTQIIIAVVGLVGVLGAAAFSNWDKLIGTENAKPGNSASPSTPGTAQTITGNNNVQVSGSNNVVNPVLQAPKLNVDYSVSRFTGATIEISNQGQGSIVVSQLTLNWIYTKCPQSEPPLMGAPMVEYRYNVDVTASDGSKEFETRDFTYGPGEIERFLIDINYPEKGVYTTWLSFDYRIPGTPGVSNFIGPKDTLSVCVGY
jgi:hypothetical protein